MQAGPESAPDSTEPLLFDAVLRPHRSLAPAGFIAVMVLVGGVSFIAGLAFLLLGAWPVIGFLGLDVALIYIAFRLSYAGAAQHEIVRLTEDALIVTRVERGGRKQSWRFAPYWLRIEADDPPRHDGAVVLSSHGQSLALARFLSPEERQDFARELGRALSRLRPG